MSKLQVWTHKYLWNVKFLKPFHIQEIQSFGFYDNCWCWSLKNTWQPLTFERARPSVIFSRSCACNDLLSNDSATWFLQQRRSLKSTGGEMRCLAALSRRVAAPPCAARLRVATLSAHAAPRRDAERTRGCALLQSRESLSTPPATSRTEWKE